MTPRAAQTMYSATRGHTRRSFEQGGKWYVSGPSDPENPSNANV